MAWEPSATWWSSGGARGAHDEVPGHQPTAIPYVHAEPPLGFALELVRGDAFARYHRLRGADTWFLTAPTRTA